MMQCDLSWRCDNPDGIILCYFSVSISVADACTRYRIFGSYGLTSLKREKIKVHFTVSYVFSNVIATVPSINSSLINKQLNVWSTVKQKKLNKTNIPCHFW